MESLEDAWVEALGSAHRLKASRKSVGAAREALLATKSSRLPSVSATVGYFWLDEAPSLAMSLPGYASNVVTLDDRFWAGGVTAKMPLFTSGRIHSEVRAAQAGWQAVQSDHRRDILDLKLDVSEAYVRVLRAIRSLSLASSSVSSLAAHYQNVEHLNEKGFVARNDLLASQVMLADARQSQIKARNGLDIAGASYNRLLSRPLDSSVSLLDLSPQAVPGDLSELTVRALAQRPELASLAEQAEALHRSARSIRASSLPTVGLSGTYLRFENDIFARDHVWTLGLVGTWNIFDCGLTRHKARAVGEKGDAVLEMLAEAREGVALQVRKAWLDVDETSRRLEVTRDAVTQAEENLKVAQDRYRIGTGTNAEVLDAETLRVRSLGNHDNAAYDAVMAGLMLRRAVGEL